MSRLLMITGALLAVVGILLIPLPGPGFLVLAIGAALLMAGAATRHRPSQPR